MTRDEKIASLSTLQGYMRFLEHESAPPFEPHAYYEKRARMIQVWWDDESAVSETVDCLTMHYGLESGKPVGVTIHQLHRLMDRQSLLTRNDPNLTGQHAERLRRYLEAAE